MSLWEKRREGERHVLKEKNVRIEKTSLLLRALKEHKLLESWICEEHYEVKVEIENHIEEKVGEIPAEKINKVVFTKY